MQRPLFIVLEGPDGAGTTKHSVLLEEYFQGKGRQVLRTFEPTDGPIGRSIRQELRSGAALDPQDIQRRFCLDRAWHLEHLIEPALRGGSLVISDRYAASTITYGAALGLDRSTLMQLNENFREPDVLLFLLPPFATLQERLARRETTDSFEREEFQRKVYAEYQRLAKEDRRIIVVDSSGELSKVAKKIAEACESGNIGISE